MSTPREKDPLAKATARPPAKKAAKKAAATSRPRSTAGPIESAVITARSAATLTGSATITAAIAQEIAKSADKAAKANDRPELLKLVEKLEPLLAVFDPEPPAGGDGDDADRGTDPVDRELERIVGTGPKVHHAKN